MGSVDVQLADDLRREVGLVRAVETGTYLGDTARKLADVFPSVITIERSDLFYERASEVLSHIPQITCVHGHSAMMKLRDIADATPSLYLLELIGREEAPATRMTDVRPGGDRGAA